MPDTIRETTPLTSMKSELSYSETLIGTKKVVAYPQSIGQLKTLKEGVTYTALDLDEERMAPGKRKAETIDVEVLFTHTQHKELKALAESGKTLYWFIKYSEDTAEVEGKPLVFSLKGSMDLAPNPVEDGDMLKDTIRIFKSSNLVETDGMPVTTDSTKY